MTPQQISIIQRDFLTVTAISRPFARVFYLRLFQLSPELSRHFDSRSDYKGRKLNALLGTAVRSLHNIDGLKVVVSSLGRRYTTQGISATQFKHFNQALLETLEMALGDEFSGEARAAWTSLSTLLLTTLLESSTNTKLAHCPWGFEVPTALAAVR